MKPLELRLQAFGPFASAQTIDFRQVSERGGLFLIHGQTGAGKTTILDGLCYALYGASSGKERDGSGMRSDFASDDLATEAELVFALGADAYRVRRRPEQRLKKKRGDGMKIERAEATFEARVEIDGEWKTKATGVEKVNAAIEGLLGMGESQFRQVAVLPQGQFRKFLIADSKEREAILERLFRTHEFRLLTEILRSRFLTLENEMKASLQALRGRLAALGASSRDDLPSLLAVLSDAENHASNDLVSAEAHLTTTRYQYDLFKLRARACVDLAKATTAMEELKNTEPQAAARRAASERHERARPLDGAIDALGRDRNERKALEDKSFLCAENVIGSTQLATQAREAVAIETAADAPSRIESELQRLDERAARAERLRPARAAQADARARAEYLARALESALDAEAASIWHADEASVLLCGLEKSAARVPALLSELETIRGRARSAQSLSRLERELQAASLQAEKDSAASAAARRISDVCELALARARAKRFAAQAAALAAKLKVDEPCPVCGSCEHPQPAVAADQDAGQALMEAAEAQARTAAETLAHALIANARAQTTVASLHASACELREDVAVFGDTTLAAEAEFARQVAFGKAMSEVRDDCERAVLRVPSAKTSAENAARVLTRSRDAVLKAREAADAGATAAREASARVEAFLQEHESRELDGASLDPDVIADEQSALSLALENAKAHRLRIQTDLIGAERALARAEASALETSERLETITARISAQNLTLQAAALRAGFMSLDDARSARLETSQYTQITSLLADRLRAQAAAQDALQRAESAKAEAETALRTCRTEASGSDEIADSEADLNLAEADFRDKVSIRASRAETARAFAAHAGEIEKAHAAMAESGATYAALGRLSKAAQGLPPENPTGVNLQRYVLASKLDLVLERASIRLGRMTRGQFSLRRLRSRDDARKSAGLDVEVEDARTGTSRPAAYLSGGESFMAALALALGLAEVVQENSGGTRLDAVFVDEGFGSLDAEALEVAMRTLSDLRESGCSETNSGRMVGVISHVPELREQIERRLFVTRGARGSTASWH